MPLTAPSTAITVQHTPDDIHFLPLQETKKTPPPVPDRQLKPVRLDGTAQNGARRFELSQARQNLIAAEARSKAGAIENDSDFIGRIGTEASVDLLKESNEYKASTHPNKVDLTLGVYRDGNGEPLMMDVVKDGYAKMELAKSEPLVYPASIAGDREYLASIKELLLGDDKELHQRTAIAQTMGGTHALSIAAALLKKYAPNETAYFSDPAWGNYVDILRTAGIKSKQHAYFNRETGGLNFEGMMRDLKNAPRGSIVILQACCHNPTGVDLSDAQWLQVAALIKQKNIRPILDMAYQGFGRGFAEDAFALRALIDADLSMLMVATSRSKNFAMYGERLGELSIIAKDSKLADGVQRDMDDKIRSTISMPPLMAPSVVNGILKSQEHKEVWLGNLSAICLRIQDVRKKLHEGILRHAPGLKVDFIVEQTGMFTYFPALIGKTHLLKEHGIFMLPNGRICVSSLNDDNVGWVAENIAKVLSAAKEEKKPLGFIPLQ